MSKYLKIICSLLLIFLIYAFLICNNLFVYKQYYDTGVWYKKMFPTGQNVLFYGSNTSGFFYHPKNFDKIILPYLYGCSQVIVYNGKNLVYTYHWSASNDENQVLKYFKRNINKFKGSKKLYVNFVHSSLNVEKNMKIKEMIIQELTSLGKDIKFQDVVFKRPERGFFNPIYQYEVIFIFNKLFYNIKKIDKYDFDRFKHIVYYGNNTWKPFVKKVFLNSEKYNIIFTPKPNNLLRNSIYFNDILQKDIYLPSTFEFIIGKKFYGIDDNLNYYEYFYNEKNGHIEYKLLKEKRLKKIFSCKVIKLNSNKKQKIFINKKPFNSEYVLLMNGGKDNIELYSKTLNIKQLKVKGIFEIKSYGRSHVKYNNGAEITFYVLPEILYKKVK